MELIDSYETSQTGQRTEGDYMDRRDVLTEGRGKLRDDTKGKIKKTRKGRRNEEGTKGRGKGREKLCTKEDGKGIIIH
jgi:hypothetical protein